MDFAARRLVLLRDCRPRADETASGRRYVDDHLALLRIVHGLGQIDFPDSRKRFALFVLRYETGYDPSITITTTNVFQDMASSFARVVSALLRRRGGGLDDVLK
jgi:hypothetical protein